VDVLVDPARKIRVGNKLYFGESDMVAEVIDNTTSRGRTINFLFDGSDDEFRKAPLRLGETPIPKGRSSTAKPSRPTRSATRLSTPSTSEPWRRPRRACTSPVR
jgi:S-adenosylmethionine:tRNA-ribosyltransferase-isomerase (queuine synthetase)